MSIHKTVITVPHQIKILNRLEELFIDDISWSNAYKTLREEFSVLANLDEEQYLNIFTNLYHKAREGLVARHLPTLTRIVVGHIAIYERAYHFGRNYKIPHLSNRALKMKEELLGFHSQEDIFVDMSEEEHQKNAQYDINKLTVEEQAKVQYYLAKMQGK